MANIRTTLHTALIALGIAAVLATSGHTADESPWSEDIRSAVRIIAGTNKNADAPLRAGDRKSVV